MSVPTATGRSEAEAACSRVGIGGLRPPFLLVEERRREASATRFAALERDDFSSNRHHALTYSWSMIFSENRFPLFGIML
jgi:acyl-[acyl carrier protein]--UDP-N-acetylglucosamine O-acyltransferase